MKKFLILSIFIFIACNAPQKLHTETYRSKEILVGQGNRSDLSKKPYSDWFLNNYKDYKADPEIVKQLQPKLNDYEITVVLGTWCGDSQEQTPALFKVLDQGGYEKKVKLFFVPRKYKDYKPAAAYHLKRVPTIILSKNGQEKGRIIEYPMQSIEKDLLEIIAGNYKHELSD